MIVNDTTDIDEESRMTERASQSARLMCVAPLCIKISNTIFTPDKHGSNGAIKKTPVTTCGIGIFFIRGITI